MGKLGRVIDDMQFASAIAARIFAVVGLLVCFVILMLVLLGSPKAHAETVAAENDAGGFIVSSDEQKCPKDGADTTLLNRAMAFDDSGSYMTGCSFTYGLYLYIQWEDGSIYRYPLQEFKPVTNFKPAPPHKGELAI